MELKSYLAVLRRRKMVVLVTAILATAITAFGSYFVLAPQYVASSTLWVPTMSSVDKAGTGDIQLGDRLINTYATLATSGPVLRALRERLEIAPAQMDAIKVSISAESIPQTELMQIKMQSTDPQLAAAVTSNLADILIDQTLKTKAGRDRRVSLFAAGGVPETPTWLGWVDTLYWREINVAIGVLLGVCSGIALACVFEYVDSTLYTKEQIESVSELSAVAEIPLVRNRRQLTLSNARAPTAHHEEFRLLRTNLFFDQQQLPNTLLITSAMPREGKSMVAANLAQAVAQSGQSVIVVDADLRLPSMHRIFGVSEQPGLSNVLRGELALMDAVQQSEVPGVRILSSGPPAPNGGSLLDSPLLAELIEQLKQRADLVILDSPALLAVSDAAVLAPLVDGVLLVVGSAQADQEAVRTARQRLASVGAKLAGVIVNRVDRDESWFRHYVDRAKRVS